MVRRLLLGLTLTAFGSWSLVTHGARAGNFVDLGPSDGISLDQPRVAIEVLDVPAEGPPVSLGPEFSNTFLLDTGANSILAVDGAVTQLNSAGYQTVAIYDEQGVAGTEPMDVSALYRFDYAGSSGARHTLNDVRIMSNSTLNFGSFNGILGMPAMVGRTTTVDMTVWSQGFPDYVGVAFSAEPPAGNGHRYTVPLTLLDFPQNGQRNPVDPLPTWSPLPSAMVHLRHGAHQAARRFVIDTGAQLSIINSQTAFALGLDEDGDGTFEQEKVGDLPLGGIGGTVDVPIVEVDSLAVGTAEGVDLTWSGLSVGVADIDPSIAGVFGMELLTSGWLEKILLGVGDDGYVEKTHFDFRDADQMSGAMLLDINPDLDVVLYAPLMGDMDTDEDVDFDDILALVLGLSDPDSYFATYGMAPAVHGDINQSGRFDFDDIAPFVEILAGGSAAADGGVGAVPEPASVILVITGLLGIHLFRGGLPRRICR